MSENETGPAPEPGRARGWRRSHLVRRFLPILVLVGIGAWLLRSQPRESTFVYDLGMRAEGLSALRVDIYTVPERSLARHVEFHYSASHPAPSEQVQSLKLARGSYEVEATLDYGGRQEKVTRTLEFDGEERLWIRL